MVDDEWKAKFQVGDLIFYWDDPTEPRDPGCEFQDDIGIVIKRRAEAVIYKKWPVQKIAVLWLHTGDGIYDDADISCLERKHLLTQDEWNEHIKNKEQIP